jgi:HEAT repeat protein
VERLAADADPLVQAAAFKAAGPLGCPAPLDALAVSAIGSAAAWEVRAGAAQALAGAGQDVAVPALTAALSSDPHADVRKAAVIALAGMGAVAAAALRVAAADPDADVRAYARKIKGTERAVVSPLPGNRRPVPGEELAGGTVVGEQR